VNEGKERVEITYASNLIVKVESIKKEKTCGWLHDVSNVIAHFVV
jgi:hypothetical protein